MGRFKEAVPWLSPWMGQPIHVVSNCSSPMDGLGARFFGVFLVFIIYTMRAEYMSKI